MQENNKFFPNELKSTCLINATLNEVSIALNGLFGYDDLYVINSKYIINNSERKKVSEEGIRNYLSGVEYIEFTLKEDNEKTRIDYFIKFKKSQFVAIKILIALLLVILFMMIFLAIVSKEVFLVAFIFVFLLIYGIILFFLIKAYQTKSLNKKFYNFVLVRIESYVSIVRKNKDKIDNKISNDERKRFDEDQFRSRFEY